jgi:hypothetical protein
MFSGAFITAKILDLGLVSFYYLVFAIVFAMALEFLTELYERVLPSKEKSTPRLLFEVGANIFFVAVAFWVIRNIVEIIPYPFEGYGGYKHSLLKETNTSIIATLVLILFQTSLTKKIGILNDRLFKST